MSFRVTPDLKAKLDATAAESGRSITQEVEMRLEASFAADVPLRLREIGQEWLLAFAHFGMQAAQDSGRPELLKSSVWLDDPDCFKRALAGALLWVVQSGHAPSVSIEYRRSLVPALGERIEAQIGAEDRQRARRADDRTEVTP